MTYPITINARTACNTKLTTVMLRHEPENAAKIIAIRADMIVNGWVGRPVIMIDCSDHQVAFTGSHRLAAAQGIDGIEAVFLPDDLTSDEWELIEDANDDDELLAAFVEIAEGRDDMGEVVETMQAELESNNQ